MPNVDLPRIGVIGVGWWSTSYHIPSLLANDRAELVAVVDPDAQRRAFAHDKFGIRNAFSDVSELCQADVVDGVVIAVPHHLHYPIARTALECGIHVLLEKPMTVLASDAWDLVERAHRAQRHLMLGYTHQMTATVQRLRAVIAEGQLGELISIAGLSAIALEPLLRGESDAYHDAVDNAEIRTSSKTYSDPLTGGQALSQLTHGVGLACYVSGLAPVEVAAFMNRRDVQVDIADAIAVRFRGDTVATFSSTGSLQAHQPGQQEYRFYGTRGYALLDLLRGTLEIHYSDGDVEQHVLSTEEIAPPFEPATRFVDLISGRGDNPAPPIPAAFAVQILEAAHSADRTRSHVHIPDPPLDIDLFSGPEP